MTTTDRASAELRRVAQYIIAHAEDIVGDVDTLKVLEDGLFISFVLDPHGYTVIEVNKRILTH